MRISSEFEPKGWMAVMITSENVNFRYSSGLPPALRMVSFASWTCLPVRQYFIRLGLERST
jgi:hypothetical protein